MSIARQTLSATFIMMALSGTAGADMIPMRDYIMLERGMSEAEVLYRVGPFDHQTSSSDYHENIIRKTWFYIPTRENTDSWITEIEFDNSGAVQSLRRYRAKP